MIFTDRARRIMQLANQEAQRFNHDCVGTEHILLGFIKEESGIGATILKNMDIDNQKVRHEVEKVVRKGPDTVIVGRLPLTPRSKKVLEFAMEASRILNHDYVDSEHFLLGLLREKEGVAVQVLMNCGLKLDEVWREVLNLFGHGNTTEEDRILTVLRGKFVLPQVFEDVIHRITCPTDLGLLFRHAVWCKTLAEFGTELKQRMVAKIKKTAENIEKEMQEKTLRMLDDCDKAGEKVDNTPIQREQLADRNRKVRLGICRLQKRLGSHGFQSFTQYYDMLFADETGDVFSELANQITTNHTFFFREPEHFDFFKSDILPWMIKEHKAKDDNDLRIWCAAASSGEEPYSLMITLLEYFGADYENWSCGLLATDVSHKALNTAKSGIYAPDRLHGVPQEIIDKYFRQVEEGYEVIDQLKQEVTYREFNLMNKTLPFKKKFDCIWCRNVMIYFDISTKHELVNRMYDATVNGGYLLIGHSETLDRSQTKWKYVKPAVYRKEDML